MAVSLVDATNEANRTGAAPPSTNGTWRSFIPLWEVALSGWFVYGVDGRLLYMNPAVRSLTRDAVDIGCSEFLLDVAPGARRAIRHGVFELRRGLRESCSVIVPIVVGEQSMPVRLAMTLVTQGPGNAVVVGSVTQMFSVGAGRLVAEDEHESAERALERIMMEVAAVLPDASPAATAPHFDDLSVRQNEILGLILAGHDTESISLRLHLSRHTVRNHTQAILRCLGVHSQADLIAYCRARQTHPSGRSALSTAGSTSATTA